MTPSKREYKLPLSRLLKLVQDDAIRAMRTGREPVPISASREEGTIRFNDAGGTGITQYLEFDEVDVEFDTFHRLGEATKDTHKTLRSAMDHFEK